MGSLRTSSAADLVNGKIGWRPSLVNGKIAAMMTP
jgi:hypothetical protein